MGKTLTSERSAAWLRNLITELGRPEKDPQLDRWTWQDGDVGVFIDQLTHVWQAVAWSPHRSVTLRGVDRPSAADITAVVTLAGLLDPPPPAAAAEAA